MITSDKIANTTGGGIPRILHPDFPIHYHTGSVSIELYRKLIVIFANESLERPIQVEYDKK